MLNELFITYIFFHTGSQASLGYNFGNTNGINSEQEANGVSGILFFSFKVVISKMYYYSFIGSEGCVIVVSGNIFSIKVLLFPKLNIIFPLAESLGVNVGDTIRTGSEQETSVVSGIIFLSFRVRICKIKLLSLH